MKLICKKEYKDFKVGDITKAIPRHTDSINNSITNPDKDELDLKFPVAGLYLPNYDVYQFINYNALRYHFDVYSIKDERKEKLQKLNGKR